MTKKKQIGKKSFCHTKELLNIPVNPNLLTHGPDKKSTDGHGSFAITSCKKTLLKKLG